MKSWTDDTSTMEERIKAHFTVCRAVALGLIEFISTTIPGAKNAGRMLRSMNDQEHEAVFDGVTADTYDDVKLPCTEQGCSTYRFVRGQSYDTLRQMDMIFLVLEREVATARRFLASWVSTEFPDEYKNDAPEGSVGVRISLSELRSLVGKLQRADDEADEAAFRPVPPGHLAS